MSKRTEHPGDGRWNSMHNRYKQEALGGETCDILLIGDSIVQQMQQTKFYTERLSKGHKIFNFGIGGDKVEHVLWRLQDGDWLEILKPKIIVLFVGTNNVNSNPKQIADLILTTINFIVDKLKCSDIIVPHLLPRGQFPNKLRKQNAAVNALLDEMLQKKEYNNVHRVDMENDKIIGEDGTIDHELLHDYLHLTDLGYRTTWTKVFDMCEEILNNITKI